VTLTDGSVYTSDPLVGSVGESEGKLELSDKVQVGSTVAGEAFDSTDTPIPILDDNAVGVTSLRFVTTDIESIEELTVELDITHPDASELTVTLIAPSETTIVLNEATEGPGTADIKRKFGLFHAAASGGFDSFEGEDPNGIWQLVIIDAVAENAGTLESWTLHLNETYPAGMLVVGHTLHVQGNVKIEGDLEVKGSVIADRLPPRVHLVDATGKYVATRVDAPGLYFREPYQEVGFLAVNQIQNGFEEIDDEPYYSTPNCTGTSRYIHFGTSQGNGYYGGLERLKVTATGQVVRSVKESATIAVQSYFSDYLGICKSYITTMSNLATHEVLGTLPDWPYVAPFRYEIVGQ